MKIQSFFWFSCLLFLGTLTFSTFTGCSSRAKENPYQHVVDFLELPNATCEVTDKMATIKTPEHSFVFNRNSSMILVDDILYYLHHPVMNDRVDARDLELLRDAIVRPMEQKHRLVVMLDAGHGGRDPGCQMETLQEKKITLEVTLEIKRLLEKQGHTVYLTRNGDTTLSLNERTKMAAEKPIDAFVSVHVNASSNPLAEGVEVFVVPDKNALSVNGSDLPKDPSISQYYLKTSTRLAFAVQRRLLGLSEKPKDRGVRHAYFRVIRDTPAPAILAEIGFVTHADERNLLATPAYRQAIARAIANGIEDALVATLDAAETTAKTKQDAAKNATVKKEGK